MCEQRWLVPGSAQPPSIMVATLEGMLLLLFIAAHTVECLSPWAAGSSDGEALPLPVWPGSYVKVEAAEHSDTIS